MPILHHDTRREIHLEDPVHPALVDTGRKEETVPSFDALVNAELSRTGGR